MYSCQRHLYSFWTGNNADYTQRVQGIKADISLKKYQSIGIDYVKASDKICLKDLIKQALHV